jgi:hypothetical protein
MENEEDAAITLSVSDASNDKGKWCLELPRQGRTILVRKRKSGKIVRKFT